MIYATTTTTTNNDNNSNNDHNDDTTTTTTTDNNNNNSNGERQTDRSRDAEIDGQTIRRDGDREFTKGGLV